MNDTTELLPHIKLRFNIEHPSFEECYAYGYECALAEMGEEENPFHAGSREFEQWQDGWWAGFYGEEPLFTLRDEAEPSATACNPHEAANERNDHFIVSIVNSDFLVNVLKITGALAATAIVGYQVFELVA